MIGPIHVRSILCVDGLGLGLFIYRCDGLTIGQYEGRNNFTLW
jgi:hypothetical protein